MADTTTTNEVAVTPPLTGAELIRIVQSGSMFKATYRQLKAQRVKAVTQSATPAINTDITDLAQITALAQAVTSMTSSLTGTPGAGDLLEIQITDNGTARAITWGASFEASGIPLPATTVISALLAVFLQWNAVTSKWRCVGHSLGTGTGAYVFATSPTLVTPVLGVATATTINKVTITQPATSATLTIFDGKTVSFVNTFSFSGTGDVTVNCGTGGDVVYKQTVSAFTRQQYFAEIALTDAANIAWDLDSAQAATVTLTDDRILDNPTNLHAGATYTLRVDAAGHALTFGNAYRWPGGVAPTLSGVCILTFLCDGTHMDGSAQLAYA